MWYGATKANELNQPYDELRKTVTEIRKDIHTQFEQIWKTNKNASGMVRELLMLHKEWINNATNLVTVVAVTYAIVAFVIISTVLGGDNDLGVSTVVDNPSFEISFVFNAIALFMSSGADMVWITLMRGETESERRIKEVIN